MTSNDRMNKQVAFGSPCHPNISSNVIEPARALVGILGWDQGNGFMIWASRLFFVDSIHVVCDCSG